MKNRLWRIIIAAILFIVATVIDVNAEWVNISIYLISYIIVGGDIIKRAIRNISRGKVFDENFLMSVSYTHLTLPTKRIV